MNTSTEQISREQPFDVFISYASEDHDWVSKLTTSLQEHGLSAFLYKKDIEYGENFVLTISDALSNSRFMLLVLSQNSVAKPWVLQEWTSFLAVHNALGKLVPIRLDEVHVENILASTVAIDSRDRDAQKTAKAVIDRVGVTREMESWDLRLSCLGRQLPFFLEMIDDHLQITDASGHKRNLIPPWKEDHNFANAFNDFWKYSQRAAETDQDRADLTRYARTVGEGLLNLLFPPESAPQANGLESLLKPGKDQATIIIRSDNDFLLSLPWELICRDGRFLVRDAMLDIVRTTTTDTDASLLLKEPHDIFRLLVNISAPADSKLHYEEEAYRIVNALIEQQTVIHTELGTLDDLIGTAQKQKNPVSGIHFSGHGGRGALVFEDDFGESHEVETATLVKRLRAELAFGMPPFFYLASCHGNSPANTNEQQAGSEGSAVQLHKAGVAEVLGYFGPIQDELSTVAEAAFYKAVSQGMPTRYAVRQARSALQQIAMGRPSSACKEDEQDRFGDDNLRGAPLGGTQSDTNLQSMFPFAWAQLVLYHRGPEYPLGLPIKADARNESELPERELTGLGRRKLLKTGFIGRRKELHRIRRAIRDGQRAFVFQGLGGLGKTTLAWKAIPLLAPEQNTCVLWCHEAEMAADPVAELTRQLLEYCRSLFSVEWEPVSQAVDRQVGDNSLQRFMAFLSVLINKVKPFALYLDNLESLLVAPHKNEISLEKPPDQNTFAEWRSIPLQQLWQQLLELAVDNKALYLLASCRYRNDDFNPALFPISPLPVDALFRMTGWFCHLGKLHPAIRLKLAGLLQGHPRAVEFCEDLLFDRWQDQSLGIPEQAEEQWSQCLAPVLPQVSERLWDDLLLNQIWEKVLDEPGRRMLFRMTLLRQPWDMELMQQLGEPGEPQQSVLERAQKLVQSSLLEEAVYPNSKGEWGRAYMLDPSTILFIRTRFTDSDNLRNKAHLVIGTYFEVLSKTSCSISTYIEAGWHLFQSEEYDRSSNQLGIASQWLQDHGYIREGLIIVSCFLDYKIQAVMDKRLLGEIISIIGTAYQMAGEVQEAIKLYQNALKIAREIFDEKNEGNNLVYLGNAYGDIGEVRKAIEIYEQAHKIYLNSGNKSGECAVLTNIGLIYADIGEVKKAAIAHEQALEIAQILRNRQLEESILGNLGIAYSKLGDFRKAIRLYEQALDIGCSTGNKLGKSRALGNIGIAYASLGEVRKAIGFLEQALVIDREIGSRRGEGVDLEHIGHAYHSLGDVSKAIGFYEQALVIDREIGDKRSEGTGLGNLGSAYYRLGEMRKAIGFYEQQLDITREIGDRQGEGNALGGLGIAYDSQQEVRKAIGFYEQQLIIAREISDKRGEGIALFNWAMALIKLEEKDKAKQLLEASLAIAKEMENPKLIAKCEQKLKELNNNP